MTPYLTTCRGVLFSDDCLNVLAELKSKTVDCVFADPPFNLGKDYKNNFNDRVTEAEYINWCERWISECARVLKPGGAFFLYALPELALQFGEILSRTLNFRHWIAITMKGTFPRGKKLYPAHYALLYYTRGEPKTFNRVRLPIPTCRHCGGEIKDYGGHRNKMNPAGVSLTDFWEDTSPVRHRKFKVRPGVNELKLTIPERAVLISTNPRDLVLDPFGGGGSTFQAAEGNDRNWIGIELHDCAHIATRLSERMPISFGRTPRFAYNRLFKNSENHEHPILRRRSRESLQARAG
jgi:site-specific DNA-methyltransferase (adenine-specific)